MPIQPRPMAETSGPFLPRRRLPTWNIESPLACEPPPRLREIKWDRKSLVARCRARNDLQFGTADPKRPRQQLHNCFIGRAVRRSLGHPDFELLAPAGVLAPP